MFFFARPIKSILQATEINNEKHDIVNIIQLWCLKFDVECFRSKKFKKREKR
jgi:hypothetical protein